MISAKNTVTCLRRLHGIDVLHTGVPDEIAICWARTVTTSFTHLVAVDPGERRAQANDDLAEKKTSVWYDVDTPNGGIHL